MQGQGKNCDKLIYFIVRVIVRFYLNSSEILSMIF